MNHQFDHTKTHGGIAVSAKCQYSWHIGELCFHQCIECMDGKITSEEIVKRDFDKEKT